MLCALTVAGPARSQELEPRAYSPAPIGTRIALAGLGNSEGAYVIDPAQPIRDVDVAIAFALVGAGYVFDLSERQARVIIVAPYAQGDITAENAGVPVSQELRGFVDPRIKFSIGLMGAPALCTADTFGNRSWLALDATWFSGGRTEVDGVASRDRQHNARAGDYETLNLTWQWV